MKITKNAVDHLNAYVEQMNVKTPCLVITLVRSGCSSYKVEYNMEEMFPEEFDIDWFSLREPEWKFFVVFKEEKLLDSTIDFTPQDKFNKQLVLDIPGVKNKCGCGESFDI